MISCKFCESFDVFKSGFVRGLQRYKCKQCGKNFTQTPFRGFPEKDKFKALVLYLSGLSMNRIAQLFGVSAVAVLKWIRALGSKLCIKIAPSQNDQVIVMEADEFWHYLKKRQKSSGFSKPIIAIIDDSLTGKSVTAIIKHSSASMIN
jgi:transposase